VSASRVQSSTTGMKAGGYYDVHSEYQRRVIEGGDALIVRAVDGLDLAAAGGSATIGDYGAGTGATSVHAVRTALAALRARDPELPLLAVHNDVISSDFSQLFRNVAGPDGYLELPGGPVYPAAAAGSFFGQVLPPASVQLGMCSNAAHWLREQPRVESPGGMFLSDVGQPARGTLAELAASDWLAFLEARAAELAPGGRLLVQGIGTTEEDGVERISASRLLAAMWAVAAELAGEGRLDRAALDGYVFPVYCRSVAEVTAPVAGGGLAGSLEVLSADVDEVSNPYWERLEADGDPEAYASSYVQFVRAFAESTMTTHLFEPGAVGVEPGALCEEYFARLERATAADPAAGRYEAWVVRLLLGRR
jgi:gibberellin A4 carboxyl methyltransferase